jgi:uncharacterized protein
MALTIRDVRETDLDSVLALNNGAGPGILPIDARRLRNLYEIATYFRVAEIGGHLAGFLIALRPGVDYDSENYAWFCAHYPDFVYVDRIVIGRPYRGHGLGRVFYADVQSYAEVRSPRLCCEVFLDPRDDASVLFHGTYGFKEEGQQTLRSGHRVSLLVKALCSFDWVRDTYLAGGPGKLPALSWLAAREAPTTPAARAAGGN